MSNVGFIEATRPPMAVTPEVTQLLHEGAVVAIGVSGGKDSDAVVFATLEYLNGIGHAGPRVLIHSDLGRLEWRESLPMCQRLAEHVGLNLIVTRRTAGDLLDRWWQRWRNNVARYVALECVKLILPWSTPALRFCTSEMKTAVICRELVRQFPGQTILSVSGIRREESTGRAKAATSKEQPKLTSKTKQTAGLDWHPILDWKIPDVWESHREWGFEPHEAYTVYGSSRVSCCFCTMASRGDLVASAACPDNQATYRALVQLEATSTFSFQSGGWLGDIAPDLLSQEQRGALAQAKERAARREAAEAQIPSHLLYTKGWPTCRPTLSEAALLAEVRQDVAAAVGLQIGYATADTVLDRYAELMAQKATKNGCALAVPVQDVMFCK
jgi:3'-phosphoadenosine 5'-phosphosulfate sulfotransferase (PAPS reductase)/FAD synthetase